MKERDRAKRWKERARLDVDYQAIDYDYQTGRDLKGEFICKPSMPLRDRYDAPLVGGPLTMTNQFVRGLVDA